MHLFNWRREGSRRGELDLLPRYAGHDDTDFFAVQVMVGQGIGLLAIVWALHILHLPRPFNIYGWCAVLTGVGGLVVMGMFCWIDKLIRAASSFGRLIGRAGKRFLPVGADDYAESEDNPFGEVGLRTSRDVKQPRSTRSKKNSRIVKSTLIIVVLDTCILIFLIAITGGIARSPFDPLLPVIPVLAVILRQPRRTVRLVLALQLSYMAVVSTHWWLHYLGIISGPELWTLYTRSPEANERTAFATVLFLGIFLSLSEYTSMYFRSKVMSSARKGLLPVVGIDMPKRMRRYVLKGANKWVGWLDWNGLATKDLSMVHLPEVVIQQAEVLSLPYWNGEGFERHAPRLTKWISFATHAAHWIDDQFDPMSLYPAERSRNLAELTPMEIVQHDARLNNLLRMLQHQARMKPQVERAVIRIVFGGKIQNASSIDLNPLLDQYTSYITAGAHSSISQAYMKMRAYKKPIVTWMTTKVVMEFFDCFAPTFRLDRSELLNLLYGPIMYYQDIKNEIEAERFGEAFASEPGTKLPDEEDALFVVNDVCRPLMETVFHSSSLPKPRRKQLSVLLALYGSALPPANRLRSAYDEFLKD